MKFDTLIEDGDWRIVRALMPNNSPMVGRWVIMQHKCGGMHKDLYDGYSFSTGKWSLCYYIDKVCSTCNRKVDPKIVGFHEMIMWNNKEDMW